MNNWNFSDARLRTERTIKHVNELNSELSRFFDMNPYNLLTEKDADTGRDVIKLRMTKSVPTQIAPIIGDAIHNLRAALDYIAMEIVVKNGGSAANVHFPFDETREGFIKTFGSGKIKRASDDAYNFILERIQPYRGGNTFLWYLNRLDRLDKHRSLIPTIAITELSGVFIECGENLGVIEAAVMSDLAMISSIEIDRKLNTITCNMRVGSDGIITGIRSNAANMKIKSYGKPTFDVFFGIDQFGTIPSGARIPVVSTIRVCAGLINSYIDAFASM